MDPREIFECINKARDNPNIIVQEIKDQLKRFQSQSVYRTKHDIKIRSISGKPAWQDAVLTLERQKSKGNLYWNQILEKALFSYQEAIEEDPNISPFLVLKNVCEYDGIAFNVNETNAEQDVIQLVAAMIVGDGDEKKGSRTAIFHPLFLEFACSVRKSGSKNVVYTVFAQNVHEKTGSSTPKKSQNKSYSESQSNWQQVQTGKFKSSPIQDNKSQFSNFSESPSYFKQKNVEETSSPQNYIKKGKQLIAELNKIRKQPKQYVHALNAEIKKFKDDRTIISQYGQIVTKQGNAPYYDLISELETQYPLPTIRQVTGLSVVALEQILQAENIIQNKVPIQQILDKFCFSSEGVRSIKLRQIEGMPISAMLMRLLVGDGDRKRTARRKMLSPICKAIGCVIANDLLIANVGETAKDNTLAVEQYFQNLKSKYGGNINGSSRKQEKVSNFQDDGNQSLSNKHSENKFFGERVVIKKTSKSHNQKKAGRIYRVIQTETIYNDGQIQNIIEEELLH